MEKSLTTMSLLLALGACSGGAGARPASTPAPVAFGTPPAAGTTVRCPVAKRDFVVPQDASRAIHQGQHYVFCCDGCKAPFLENPGKYLGKQPRR